MSGLERREAIIRRAIQDAELVACLKPVVAAGFGVIPLRRLGDVLTVACSPRANRSALRVLRELLQLEVVATPFEDHLLREAIDAAYLSDERAVNFPTFLDPDFLEDPEAATILGREKVEQLPEVRSEQAPGRVTLATLAFRTRLIDSDAAPWGGRLPSPERSRVRLGELEIGWRRAPRPILFDAPDELGGLVVTQYRSSEYRHLRGGGWIDDHGIETEFAPELPLVIHPTEIQIVGITASGGLRVHVYEQEHVFEPGGRATLSLTYHFLSYGSRMSRRIELEALEVVCVDQDQLERRGGACAWGPLELGRWFGLQDA